MVYPPDATTTTFYIDSYSSTSTIITNTGGNTYTILGINAGTRGASDSGLFCTPRGYIWKSHNTAGSQGQQLTHIKCTGNLLFDTQGALPVSWNAQANITYIPYDIIKKQDTSNGIEILIILTLSIVAIQFFDLIRRMFSKQII